MRLHVRKLAVTALVLLGLLQGCASVELAAPIGKLTFPDELRYGARPAIPQPAAIVSLTAEQQAAFLAYLNDPFYQFVPVHVRVASYLETLTSGFHFQGDTLIAADAFAVNGGNCLSLALMTTALADLAGVRIGYQLLDDLPVYEVQGTIVEKGYHVRSILYEAPVIGASRSVPLTGGVKIDYFPTGQQRFVANLTRETFIAMYYRNIAAEAIAAGDHARAYWYLRESLLYAPNDSQAINMLAVVSRRTGDPARAEELYLHGLAHADEKLTLLKNYQVLLARQGREAEARRIGLQLESMNDASPFHWFQLAREAYQSADYRAAIRYYRKALERAPYMHEAYLGVAQSQYEMGQAADARVSLQRALDHVYRPTTRKLYKAKLYAISGGSK